MTAITISRQLGSLGCEVAQAVGAALGYRVVWRDLINQAAQRAGSPEMALHAIDELGLLGYKPTPEAQQAYQDALRQVMEELAREGSVILVGRAGQAILKGWPQVLHVRIIAPAGLRAERLAADQRISLDAAWAQVDASDRARKNFLRRFYQMDWEDPVLYDLVINTERMTIASSAQVICKALSDYNQPSSANKPSDLCID